MEINVSETYARALKKGIDKRIGNNDPTITYQEFVLYYILYLNNESTNRVIDPSKAYEDLYKDSWIDETWLQLDASKTHPKIFEKKWNEVF